MERESKMTEYQRGFYDGVAECKYEVCRLIKNSQIRLLDNEAKLRFETRCLDGFMDIVSRIKTINFSREDVGDIGDWK